jgi:murein L,D-transpeptidase YafK
MARWLLSLALLGPALVGAQEDGRLPAYLLQLPDSVTTILVAETDSSALHHIRHGADGTEYLDQRYMSVGQNGVGKKRPWDRRTPLGIYFVNEQLDTTKLHERYGPTAFPLDYPNAWDRINDRSGDGIWIHGVDESGGRRPPLDTDGCIALPNDDLLALEPLLVPVVTPVVITRRVRWASPAEISATRDEIASAVDAWIRSIRGGDLHSYLSLYADDFEYRGMNRDEWARYRVQTIGARSIDDVLLSDLLLLADPEDTQLYLSRFRQTLVEGDRNIVTMKRLYWRRGESGELKIVAEDNG